MLHKARTVASTAAVTLALVLGTGISAADAVQARTETHPEWGRTATKAHILKRSCRNYRYTYAITPPQGNWGLETFLVGPGGVHLASGAMVVGMDGKTGHDYFRVCRPSTRPGIFKIKALVSIQDDQGKKYQQGWLPVTKFRLRAAR